LGGGGYFSYFTASDELKDAQDYFKDLEDELKKLEEKEDNIHTKLVKLGKAQPKEVFNLKKWAVYSLIGAVGIAGALQLAGIGAVGLATGAVSLIPSWGAVTSTVTSAVGLGMSALQMINALFFAEYTLKMLKARLFEEENKPEPNEQKIEDLYQQLEEQEEIITELHKALIAKQAQEKK